MALYNTSLTIQLPHLCDPWAQHIRLVGLNMTFSMWYGRLRANSSKFGATRPTQRAIGNGSRANVKQCCFQTVPVRRPQKPTVTHCSVVSSVWYTGSEREKIQFRTISTQLHSCRDQQYTSFPIPSSSVHNTVNLREAL